MKDLLLSKISKVDAGWIDENRETLAKADEIRANTKIVLKLRRYMREHCLTQKEFAELLGVTPQYVNKLLRGKELNLSISTAIRYGKILGIELLSIPENTPVPNMIAGKAVQENIALRTSRQPRSNGYNYRQPMFVGNSANAISWAPMRANSNRIRLT